MDVRDVFERHTSINVQELEFEKSILYRSSITTAN